MSHTIIDLKKVSLNTNLSRSSIYCKLDKNHKRYDATFPKPVKLSLRSIGWVESEVNDWIESRIAARGRG